MLKATGHRLAGHLGLDVTPVRKRTGLDRTVIPRPFGSMNLEFRHSTWHVEDVFAILKHHGAAYCVMSSTQLPCILRLTAPFAYVRLHGPGRHLHDGSYSDTDLIW